MTEVKKDILIFGVKLETMIRRFNTVFYFCQRILDAHLPRLTIYTGSNRHDQMPFGISFFFHLHVVFLSFILLKHILRPI